MVDRRSSYYIIWHYEPNENVGTAINQKGICRMSSRQAGRGIQWNKKWSVVDYRGIKHFYSSELVAIPLLVELAYIEHKLGRTRYIF
jgi:hypothetical protein